MEKVGLFLLLLGVVAAQQNNTTSSSFFPFLDDEFYDQDYPYVVCLKLHLKEETLPQLFTEFALQNIPCSFQECRINMIEIIQAVHISRFSTNVLAEALQKLNVSGHRAYATFSKYPISSSLIQELLQRFGFTFSELYTKFVESLPDPRKNIEDIMRVLKIDVSEFMNAQLYGNDTVRLQVLSSGNYSEENINAAVAVTNKTTTELLQLIPLNIIAARLNLVDANEFTKLVKDLGITTENWVEFYQYLSITPLMFLSYAPFIQTIATVYDNLNPEDVLATYTSANTLYTTNKAEVLGSFQAQSPFVKTYTNFHAEPLENPLMHHLVKIIKVNNPLYIHNDLAEIEIDAPHAVSFVNISTNYANSSWVNCAYISKSPLGGLYIENLGHSRVFFVNSTIFVLKSNITLYNLGSPLICQDELMGIASSENEKQITFSTFAKRIIMPPPVSSTMSNVIHPPETAKPVTTGTLPETTIHSNAVRNVFPTLVVLVCGVLCKL